MAKPLLFLIKIINHSTESVKQTVSVPSSRSGFRMELHGKDRGVGQRQTLDSIVVQIPMGHFHIAGQRLRVNTKPWF